jgi:hypothetical protein
MLSRQIEMRLKRFSRPRRRLGFRPNLKASDRDLDFWRAHRSNWRGRLRDLPALHRLALVAAP